jgi:hypothetical protein
MLPKLPCRRVGPPGKKGRLEGLDRLNRWFSLWGGCHAGVSPG